jgi:Mrp family chromosome partitioning ATPase
MTGGSIILSSNPLSTTLRYYPLPTPRFTGRMPELNKINRYFGSEGLAHRIYVLYGLGGAGKTQTALAAARLMEPK